MAYDEGLAALLREDLAGLDGVAEKKMFGGLAFMKDGHMLCGVRKGGGMFRVGKPHHEAALAIAGVSPMAFTGAYLASLTNIFTGNFPAPTKALMSIKC